MKMAILPKAFHRFNATLTKIPMSFFAEIEKSNTKVYMEVLMMLIVRTILSKKINTRGITILNFKLYSEPY
jgi:hypothetical protein